jgi:tRNA (cytidine/uridine-2'-O-)-methyltransferase
VAVGATLHLIGRLGFRLDSREIRRAGLDYWPKLKLVRHDDFDAFLGTLPPEPSLLVFSTKADRSFRQAPYRADSCLLFGSESRGLPEDIRRRFAESLYRIPVGPEVRSLNLSTAAAVAVYEALRHTGL